MTWARGSFGKCDHVTTITDDLAERVRREGSGTRVSFPAMGDSPGNAQGADRAMEDNILNYGQHRSQ